MRDTGQRLTDAAMLTLRTIDHDDPQEHRAACNLFARLCRRAGLNGTAGRYAALTDGRIVEVDDAGHD